MTNFYRTVLSIAGSDSCGGAGIQADLKTFAALGCYGMSAVTALTAQNTTHVNGIHPIPPNFVEQQIETIFTDNTPHAIKIGMLFSKDIVLAVCRQLNKHRTHHIILDPVMISQSSCHLLKDDAIDAIVTELMPLVDIITPNIHEASYLTNIAIETLEDMEKAAHKLSELGKNTVVIKGGHLAGRRSATDVIYFPNSDSFFHLEKPRITTNNCHGTGCTLSSAIAAFIARGEDTISAIQQAKNYIHSAIEHGARYTFGKGSGPIHHFFHQWESPYELSFHH